MVLSLPLTSAVRTDVLAEVIVDTDQHLTFQTGDRVELPCRVHRKVHSVTWSKGHTVQTADVLVFLSFDASGLRKAGQGYESGFYDIDSNFTLIVNSVNVRNHGLYFCEILDWESGRTFGNQTDVAVWGEFSMLFFCSQNTMQCSDHDNLAVLIFF